MKTKLLIANDDTKDRDFLEILLRSGGYNVVTAAGGAEALEKLKREPFDGIVSDILMPGMDGFVFLRECRKDPTFRSRWSGHDLIISCEDDGVGIAQECRPRLFERGFGKHTGLGLYLSREILAITRMTITENGEPGCGARFEISVPEGGWRIAGTLR
ncbi:MAG: response regulator [Methanoregula sp.]